VGTELKRLRLQMGLTQEQLGEALNLSKQALSGYENGRRSPSIDTLIKVADFFNVSLDELLGRNSSHCANFRLCERISERRDILALVECLVERKVECVKALHTLIYHCGASRGDCE